MTVQMLIKFDYLLIRLNCVGLPAACSYISNTHGRWASLLL